MLPIPSLPSLRRRGSTSRLDARRAVLLWAVASGVLVPIYFVGIADVSHFAWDYRAYYIAAEAALAGEPFVGITPGLPGVAYVYPPISVALFLPQAAVGGWRLAFALQTLLNVLAALGVAALATSTIETYRGRLSRVDRLLVVGFCLGTAPMVAVLGLGQVDSLIALALAGTFVALEHDRQSIAGAVLAGAALVKVFPVVLGLWLVWRRAWRAVVAAVVTGLAGLALGALLFGIDAYRRYFDVLAGRSRIAEFADTVSPDFFAMSLYRPLSQALPSVDPSLYAVLAGLFLSLTVGFVAHRERGFLDRLRTYLVAITAMLLVSPASNSLYVVYVFFPLVCLLYLDTTTRGQSLLLGGTAAITFPVQPAQIGAAVAIAGVPAPFDAHILAAAQTALTVVSVPLVGLLAILGWCLLRAAHREATVNTTPRPTGGD